MTKSKIQRLAEAFQRGDKLTAAQIRSRFGIANPTAAVSDLRLNHGYAVSAAHYTDPKGRTTTKYSLGTPPREVVAAGYRVMAGSVV